MAISQTTDLKTVDTDNRRIALKSGLYTLLFVLIGPFGSALLVVLYLTEVLGHNIETTSSPAAAVIMIGATISFNALWGRSIAKLIGSVRDKVMMAAGAASILPPIVGMYTLVVYLDNEVFTGPPPPTHVGYTLTFVPWTFIVAFSGSFALSLAGNDKLAVGTPNRCIDRAGGSRRVSRDQSGDGYDWFPRRRAAHLLSAEHSANAGGDNHGVDGGGTSRRGNDGAVTRQIGPKI